MLSKAATHTNKYKREKGEKKRRDSIIAVIYYF
jgi:hypothetical protein